MNRYISKSYTTSKNAIDRQYIERGQLQCQLFLVNTHCCCLCHSHGNLNNNLKEIPQVIVYTATTVEGRPETDDGCCNAEQQTILFFFSRPLVVKHSGNQSSLLHTVEPRLTATSIIQSPRYYPAQQNGHTFPFYIKKNVNAVTC